MSLVLPKPVFDSCDETSLKLKWGNLDTAGLRQLRLQYKDVHLPWEQAKFVSISLDNPSEVNLTAFDVVDLEPGTPYSVRLAVVYQTGEEQFGPETVFDTKPIDCTPKQKKCVIC